MKLPAKYEAARKALALAVRVDEVKSIRDKALAMEVYAFQAKDGELAAAAVELKRRATRRLGELMKADREAGKLAKGTRGQLAGGVKKAPPAETTLADQGIDKSLAKAAREAERTPEDQFEAETEDAKRAAIAAAEGDKKPAKDLRRKQQDKKRAKRAARERDLGEKIEALPDARFGVILADPPWRFDPYSDETGMDRAAENHYPTMRTGAIAALEVPAADDCVLFLWATAPMLPAALEVMRAWGFEYKSHFVWVKDRLGTGYWTRNKHELLLIGTRGKVPAPAMGDQYESAISAPVGKHSAKPECFREIIEDMFPTLPRVELFAREPRSGWSAWGNEV